jgi:Zinc knuckle
MTYREIGKALGLSKRLVCWYAHRALRQLHGEPVRMRRCRICGELGHYSKTCSAKGAE